MHNKSILNPNLHITEEKWTVSLVRTGHNARFNNAENEARERIQGEWGKNNYPDPVDRDRIQVGLLSNMIARRTADAEDVFILIQAPGRFVRYSLSTAEDALWVPDSLQLIQNVLQDAPREPESDFYRVRFVEMPFTDEATREDQFNAIVWNDIFTENKLEHLAHKTWLVDSMQVRNWATTVQMRGLYFEGGKLSYLAPQYSNDKRQALKNGLAVLLVSFIGAALSSFMGSSECNVEQQQALEQQKNAEEQERSMTMGEILSPIGIIMLGFLASGTTTAYCLYKAVSAIRHNSTTWCLDQLDGMKISHDYLTVPSLKDQSIRCPADSILKINGELTIEIQKIKNDITNAYLDRYMPPNDNHKHVGLACSR